MFNVDAVKIKANRIWVSKNTALKILTPSQIDQAVNDGIVRCRKRDQSKQNGRWDFNLWDLLKLCDISSTERRYI